MAKPKKDFNPSLATFKDKPATACPPGFAAQVEYISPARAAFLLQHNQNVRRANRAKINVLKQDMINGDWEDNGAGIKFQITPDGKEVLVDGQNRLHAIVESKRGQWMVVIRGLKSSNFVDLAEKRTFAQWIKKQGYPYSREIASTVSLVMMYKAARAGKTVKVAADQANKMRTFQQYEKLILSWVQPCRSLALPWTSSVAAVMALSSKQPEYPAAKDDFVECLASGFWDDEPLAARDACAAVRDIQATMARERTYVARDWRLAIVIKAWNFHRRRTLMPSPNSLKWQPEGPTGEKMPEIV